MHRILIGSVIVYNRCSNQLHSIEMHAGDTVQSPVIFYCSLAVKVKHAVIWERLKAEQLIVLASNVLCKWFCMSTDGCQNGPNWESATAVKTWAVLTNSESQHLYCIPNVPKMTSQEFIGTDNVFQNYLSHLWNFCLCHTKLQLKDILFLFFHPSLPHCVSFKIWSVNLKPSTTKQTTSTQSPALLAC